jgi:plasmid stabilization system protein ParE
VPAETPVRFHPEADEEVLVIADWYDEHGQGGDLFLAALGETLDGIAAAPWRWPIVQGITPPARRRLMARFPYSVYYRIDDEGVLIVAIAHQRREHLYWLGR